MAVAANLRAARALLSPPGAWLSVSFEARARDGRVVQARSRDAVAWGMLAALVVVTGPQEDRRAELEALKLAAGKPRHLCDWLAADGRTQAEVLEALDCAAEAADDPYGYGRAA